MTRLPDRARSRAFLFGVASYTHPETPDLPAVGNNLRDLRRLLTSPDGAFAPEHCTVMADPATPQAVYNALRHEAAQAEDTLLVYFAGHGERLRGGGLGLVLKDTTPDDVDVSCLEYDKMHALLRERTPAAHRIVILDCCYSGRAVPAMSGGRRAAALKAQLEIEGACVLTSSAATRESLAPHGATYTSFTGELLRLLGEGVPGAESLLSLELLSERLARATRLRGLPEPVDVFQGSTRHIALVRNRARPAAGRTGPAAAARTGPASARRAGSAAVAPPAVVPTHVSRPLVFAGEFHATKKDLARTVRAHWADAARRFFEDMGTREEPSESWRELRAWLREFTDPLTDDVEGRIALVDRYLTDPGRTPDHKLLHLLRWLDPDGPVVLRGTPLTYRTLMRSCLARYGGDGEAGLPAELEAQRLLPTLAGFRSLRRLAGVQEAWEEALRAWRVATAVAGLPDDVRAWAAATGPGALLAALLPPKELDRIRDTLPAAPHRPERTTQWYDRLLKAAGGRQSLLGGLVEAEFAERAGTEARLRAEEKARRAAEAARRQAEADERRRRAEEEQREREAASLAAPPQQPGTGPGPAQAPAAGARGLRAPGKAARTAAPTRSYARDRTTAVLAALAIGTGWALVPAVVVWVTWWFTSYDVDAAETLSLAAGLTGAAVLGALLPCAVRLGSGHRPRLGAPSSWVPPVKPALTASALLLLYWLLGRNSSARADHIKADSDLLRGIGWGPFWDYAGQNAFRPSGGDILVSLLLLPVMAGCGAAGYRAGRELARRWERRQTGR
ncbi:MULTISPECIES: caspase family protein [unclassified Streptomyces]|uniref:caspase, EACC1-associated type n=1 Tax=unclassified Streptomyces TaxID=2593676 RepID=UPI0036F6D2A7